jgi:NitT/TauT family transport system ATP-binding protein
VVREGSRRLRFAAVHQNSSHNYELRYWLAASGIMPDRDVEIVILPPPLLPDALGSGGIDGYCVGEPWNSIGVEAGVGRIVTTKASIWPKSPDKVLGVRETWAQANPDLLGAVIRALLGAARWCGDRQHWAEAADLLARPEYLSTPSPVIVRALQGRLRSGSAGDEVVEQFYVPHAGGANLPSARDAAWYYTQMVRWGEVPHSAQSASLAVESFRPDLYRAALLDLGTPLLLEHVNPSPFFDGIHFDAEDIQRYIALQAVM